MSEKGKKEGAFMGFFKNFFLPKIPKEKAGPVHMVVDDTLINANDVQGVIEPLWWSVSIYDGEEKYEKDLEPFTTGNVGPKIPSLSHKAGYL